MNRHKNKRYTMKVIHSFQSKNLGIFPIIGLLLAVVLFGAASNQSGKEYKKMLLGYINKIAEVPNPETNQLYYLNIGYITYRGTMNSPKRTEFEILMSKNKLVYKSNKTDVYKDRDNTFFILEPQKTIVWADGGPVSDKDVKQNKIHELQRSIIENCEIHEVEHVKEGAGKFVAITAVPSKADIEQFKIKHIRFVYNRNEEKLERTELQFLQGNQVKKQVIEYRKLDYNYQGNIFNSADEMVFTREGKLLPKYATYNIINRKTQ